MNQDKIWHHFQNSGVDSFRGAGARLRYLTGKIRPQDEKVLNIGVGSGVFETLIRERTNCDIYSLDPDGESIERLRNKLMSDEGHMKVGYSQDLPFADAMFDIVFMTEVVEHLDDKAMEETLGQVRRVLKPGGRFIGTVPADERLRDNQVICPECGTLFHRWGHQQSFSSTRLETMLASRFSGVGIKAVYLVDWRILNVKGKAGWLIKKLLLAAGIRGSGGNYYFCAWKPADAMAGQS